MELVLLHSHRDSPPSRLARPSAPSAGVPAAFTFELHSAGVRCAPRIPGLCPRQQKTRQAGDPRSGGYPPPLDPGSGAQPGAQHCGTCGGRGLPPPGGRKTRGSPATQVRVRSPALPQAWRVQAGRLQTRGEQRPWPCASASPRNPRDSSSAVAAAPHTWAGARLLFHLPTPQKNRWPGPVGKPRARAWALHPLLF